MQHWCIFHAFALSLNNYELANYYDNAPEVMEVSTALLVMKISYCVEVAPTVQF